jgi:nucleotide-binding universal stress UspA family protein
MLDYVCANRALFDPGHQYTIFNAQAPLPPHARSALGSNAVNEYHTEEAHKVLGPAEATLTAKGLKGESAWKVGPPGEAIARFAADGGFDMVIMGSHGHGALARLVMGSTTTQVLAQCGVPVLLVR